MSYEDCYRTNLHHVRSLGYQITQNEVQLGIRGPLSAWPGVAEMGHSDSDTPPERRGFIPDGYEYLSVQLGSQVGYFKSRFRETPEALAQFYQYNQPRTTRDTLYLRYWEFNYRIFYH